MNAKPTIPRTAAEEELLSRFEAAGLAGAGAGALRRGALAQFAQTGLPHRRVEAYKYTDLKRLMTSVPPIAAAPDAVAATAALKAVPGWIGAEVNRLVFVDGHFVAALSAAGLGDGVRFASLADVLASETGAEGIGDLPVSEQDTTIALNTAFMQDGAVVSVAAGAKVETPIELVHVTTGETASYPRHRIDVGAGANVAFVETFTGPTGAEYQVNAAVEIDVADGASVSWLKRQEEGDGALHLSSMIVRCAEGAAYSQTGFAIGGKASRAQTFLSFAGSGATATLNSAVLAQDRQHHDTTMVIDHAVAGCESREAIKTVIDDEAKGIFQGRIIVRPDAQQTDGRMMARSLLLSEGGEAIAKPELEIYADDVQCAHGATSGEIDADMMFYLMARGIPHDEAERMLIAAFLEEIVDGIAVETLRETLSARVGAWLQARRRAA